jgi:hypothetical protein
LDRNGRRGGHIRDRQGDDIREYGVNISLLDDTFPVIVGMNGNTVLVAPGFDVKAAGSLFLEKSSPSGELSLSDLQICIHRDNLPVWCGLRKLDKLRKPT